MKIRSDPSNPCTIKIIFLNQTRRCRDFTTAPTDLYEVIKGEIMKHSGYCLFRRSLLIASLTWVLLTVVVSDQAYAQAKHMKVNGAGADGSACGSNGLCSGVSVGRNGNGPGTETFLSFFSSRVDPATNLFTNDFGFGIIPNEDLVGDVPGQALKNLSLNTDIARVRAFNPDFVAFRLVCQAPPCGGICPCTGGPLLEGVLAATFTQTDAYTSRSHGTFEEKFNLADGSFLSFRSVGMSESSSATWTVNFFGVPLNTNFSTASLGAFRSVDIIIEKTAH